MSFKDVKLVQEQLQLLSKSQKFDSEKSPAKFNNTIEKYEHFLKQFEGKNLGMESFKYSETSDLFGDSKTFKLVDGQDEDLSDTGF